MAAPAVVARAANGVLGDDLWRWAVRLSVLALLAALLPLALALLAFGALLGQASGRTVAPAVSGSSTGGAPTHAAVIDIPAEQLAAMRQAAATAPCPLDWSVLAAIARVESGFGSNMATSSAGAIGYGQFLPSTWALPGIGNSGNPYDYHDALPAMARYLCQSGAGTDLHGALFAYNHADWYVDEVLGFASQYATRPVPAGGAGLQAGWANAPAVNQYDQRNYASTEVWQEWRACSAAALDWLLGAYGVRLGRIDRAIALIGPNTGISTTLGLLDASGAPLAQAIAGTGLVPRHRNVHSIAELERWLDQGPLALDGAAWFGVGHWFVATGYDQNGIFIRDSSGWDTRYLPWSRLYGQVGFDGWVVGVEE
jgi:hypothetical protein